MVIQHVLPTEAGEDAIVTHVNSSSTVGEVGTEKSAGVSESDQYLSSWRLAIVITSLCLGTFLIALDINIIGVAVPKIATTFRSLDDVAWYGSAYLLTVTAFQPVMGFSYKYFSMLATYLICVATFEVGSVLCAAASSSVMFIVGRAIAGLGAAGLLQGALCIIGHAVRLNQRPLFMSVVISVFGVSVCIGPLLGGAFIDNVGWRWCFWINVPIGGVVVVVLYFFLRLRNTRDENRRLSFMGKLEHMDIIGTVLFLGTICCLVFSLQWGGQKVPWKSSEVIGLLVGFFLLTLAFIYCQWKRGDDALIPLRVLRQRSIMMGSCYLFFFGMLNYAYSFYLPFYFQRVQGVAATTSGVRIIPMVLPQIVSLIVVGALVTKWRIYVPYMIVGQAIAVIGAGLVTRFDSHTSMAAWASFLVVTGIGMGLGMQLPYTAVQVVLSQSDAPTGNAICVFSNQLGGVIAIPIGQALLLSGLRDEIPRLTSVVSADAIIGAGGSNLTALAAGNELVLAALREGYGLALRRVFIFALAAGCAAFVFTLGMERRTLTAADGASARGERGELEGAGESRD